MIMAYKSNFMLWLEEQSELMCIDLENSYIKIKVILEKYRTLNWATNNSVNLTNIDNYDIYGQVYGEDRFSFLTNYVSDSDMKSFEVRLKTAVQTKEFSELIQAAVLKVREYPKKGEEYYKILDMKYMNYFDYSEDEILEQLEIERSTYFRKKKEAMYLLGYVLFGFTLPGYMINAKTA
jgi:hypothetical protein